MQILYQYQVFLTYVQNKVKILILKKASRDSGTSLQLAALKMHVFRTP